MPAYKLLLDSALFHRNMDGKLIPHSINPGPNLTCKACGNARCGKDFTTALASGQVVQLAVCRYCANVGGR